MKIEDVLTWLAKDHRASIATFGVITAAFWMLEPAGVITRLFETYAIHKELLIAAIIIGVVIKRVSRRLWLRWLGILPYTCFTVLAVSLWTRGITPLLLQSQIGYIVIGSILAWPLVSDTIKYWLEKHHA